LGIKRDIVDKIHDRADIIEIISDYVTLKKRGVNYIGLCPFHDEKTPSFTVSPSKNIYKCFGCGKAGGTVNFLMEHEQLTYFETLETLAKKYNITLEFDSAYDKKEHEKAQLEYEESGRIYQITQNYFMKELLNHDKAMDYLIHKRKLTENTITKFKLGFVPSDINEFVKYLKSKGENLDSFMKQGIFSNIFDKDRYTPRTKYASIFQGILIPIQNHMNRIEGFASRYLNNDGSDPFAKEKKPIIPGTDKRIIKFINSSEETHFNNTNGIYTKHQTKFKKKKILFGLNHAKKLHHKLKQMKDLRELSLVEGHFDVMMLDQNEIPAVGSGGTAFTKEQARLLKRMDLESILVMKDGDVAGYKSSQRDFFQLLNIGITPCAAVLPKGQDPDDIIRNSHDPIKTYKEIARLNLGTFLVKTEIEIYKSLYEEKYSSEEIEKKLKDPLTKYKLISNIFDRDEFKEEGMKESILIPHIESIVETAGFEGSEKKAVINKFIDQMVINKSIRYNKRRRNPEFNPKYDHHIGNLYLAHLFLLNPEYTKPLFKEIHIESKLFTTEQRDIYRMIEKEFLLSPSERKLEIPIEYDEFAPKNMFEGDPIEKTYNYLTNAVKMGKITRIPPALIPCITGLKENKSAQQILEETKGNKENNKFSMTDNIDNSIQLNKALENDFESLTKIIKMEIAHNRMNSIKKELIESLKHNDHAQAMRLEEELFNLRMKHG